MAKKRLTKRDKNKKVKKPKLKMKYGGKKKK